MIFHIGNYGWARVEIGEDGSIFTGSASYLNDTPIDFLEEFKRCVNNYSTPTIKCDEEGSEFIIVVDDYRTYIISERDETRFFIWEIDIKDLNIREGAGINYTSIGKTGKGTFTITEEALGKVDTKGTTEMWGLLKSYSKKRNGWVCLSYVKKL